MSRRPSPIVTTALSPRSPTSASPRPLSPRKKAFDIPVLSSSKRERLSSGGEPKTPGSPSKRMKKAMPPPSSVIKEEDEEAEAEGEEEPVGTGLGLGGVGLGLERPFQRLSLSSLQSVEEESSSDFSDEEPIPPSPLSRPGSATRRGFYSLNSPKTSNERSSTPELLPLSPLSPFASSPSDYFFRASTPTRMSSASGSEASLERIEEEEEPNEEPNEDEVRLKKRPRWKRPEKRRWPSVTKIPALADVKEEEEERDSSEARDKGKEREMDGDEERRRRRTSWLTIGNSSTDVTSEEGEMESDLESNWSRGTSVTSMSANEGPGGMVGGMIGGRRKSLERRNGSGREERRESLEKVLEEEEHEEAFPL
ncbi:hypothetical protein BT69DRAFT_1287590 [Atractiella rhizophila]|nr:hypothetical protein BT69DRAFT_1287590 [Atractiella rhizophila]